MVFVPEKLRAALLPLVVALVAALAFGAAAALGLFTLAPWPASSATAALVELGAGASLRSSNAAGFESGNIGGVERTGPASFALQLRSDNDDALPMYWRQWFYAELSAVPVDRTVTITLSGAGQWSYYLPFFSYDNVHWQQFDAHAVTQPSRYSLQMQTRFLKPTVYLARYEPYTYSRLTAYLSRIKKHPDVVVTALGQSVLGHPVPLITIGAPTAVARVEIHARTHPGEVGSSFLLEGFVDYLLGSTETARRLRANLQFTILPMLNVDGVVLGNNRVSGEGINLEGKWFIDEKTPLALETAKVPREVALYHDHLVALLRQKLPVTLALNLHASAGEPADNVFIFPHFGPLSSGYHQDEARLYAKQRQFIAGALALQGKDWFNPPPGGGSRAFLAKAVPEAWWWHNFKDQVTALTIESTYGHAGKSERWVQPDDMRRLGLALARAVARFHGLDPTQAVGTGVVKLSARVAH